MSEQPEVRSATIWFDGYPIGHELYGPAIASTYFEIDDGNGRRAWPVCVFELGSDAAPARPRRAGISLTTGHLIVELDEKTRVAISPDGFMDAYNVARNANGELREP